MSYTPVEIRHVKLGRGLFGYRRQAVDRLLDEISDSFETVWRGRADHADRVELLEGELTRYRELEALLRATLVSAERSAHELRDQTKREAESILAEAHAAARTITRDARAERERLVLEARRLRVLLHAALDALDEAEEDPPIADEGPETRAA
ncbi:MAG: DivIVA domain-containing protein [Verrucomicrobiota bacterium]